MRLEPISKLPSGRLSAVILGEEYRMGTLSSSPQTSASPLASVYAGHKCGLWHAAAGVDVLDLQATEFFSPQAMMEKRGEERAVA